MNIIEQLFDRMDDWRHLPNYQLERRADLLFSLYLQQVLFCKTKTEINPICVPEFPVRIGTINPDTTTNMSYKIDYLAVSKDGKKAFLIELKTDMASRRDSQDKYLIDSKAAGMNSLLDGVLKIFGATKEKRKYLSLLVQLEAMGLLALPEELKAIMQRNSLRGVTEASRQIQKTSNVSSCDILYIQPVGHGKQIISFAEFADVIEDTDDLFAKRFACSLREWADVKAGK